MPEIAEVETFRRQLEPLLVGKTINSCACFHARSIRRHNDSNGFISRILQKKVIGLTRHGKYLALILEDNTYLNIHLRMSGRLLTSHIDQYDANKNPKHSHVIFSTDSDVFVFVDPRTFGELWATEGKPEEHLKGVDALKTSAQEKHEIFLKNITSKRTLKGFLLDQNFITGIGNIYSDEICFYSKLRPDRTLNSLSPGDIKKVVMSIEKVILHACELRGSSLRDESFRDLHGEIGSFQKEHRVHAKAGQVCKCGSEIKKIKVASRSTYLCPSCQK